MSGTIKDPALLSCSRVNVVDVRPVLHQGQKPLDSVRNSLSALPEHSTLLLVVPCKPSFLTDVAQNMDFSLHHDKITASMQWMAIHPGTSRVNIDITGPGPSYALPAGRSGHAAFLDCRALNFSETMGWMHSTLSGLAEDDLLVIYRNNWEGKLQNELTYGTIQRKSIFSKHVRLEVTPE